LTEIEVKIILSTEGAKLWDYQSECFSGSVSLPYSLFCAEAILYPQQTLFGFERGRSVVEVRKIGNCAFVTYLKFYTGIKGGLTVKLMRLKLHSHSYVRSNSSP
jgi:hypothetical protein